MNKNSNFVLILKKQLKKEFSVHDRKGVYAYTQKIMAYNSNRIEGSTLTSEQTASLFDTGSLVGDSNEIYRAKDIEEMTGHFKMFNEVIKSLDKPLTIEMIKSFHFQLKAGVFEDYANGYPVGEFKKYKNHVSDIETELPENIPDKIAELIHKYEKSDKTLKDIVVFHAEYERTHAPQQASRTNVSRSEMVQRQLQAQQERKNQEIIENVKRRNERISEKQQEEAQRQREMEEERRRIRARRAQLEREQLERIRQEQQGMYREDHVYNTNTPNGAGRGENE